MRFLASADLHGYHDVYDWLVEVVAVEQPEGVVLAGDLLGFPDGFDTVEEAQAADGREVIARLAEVACPIFYVMGNDDWVELNELFPISSRSTVPGSLW